MAEQLREARRDAERHRDELGALRADLEAARADAAAAHGQVARAAEEHALLAALHEGWQQLLDVARRQRDEALHQAGALAAERQARVPTPQRLPAPPAARETVPALGPSRPAVTRAPEQENIARGPKPAPATAPPAATRLIAREPSRPAPEEKAGGGHQEQRPPDRTQPSLWVCLPLAVFLWVASRAAGGPVLTRDDALHLLFALSLLLQFRLWDELEDAGDGGAPDRAAVPLGLRHFLLVTAVAWNVAYLTFSGSWQILGAFAALSAAFLLWYRGLRRRFPAPLASSQLSLLRYPALVYLLAAPTSNVPEAPLLFALALVYLGFSAFALLHDGRLRAVPGASWALALALALMLGLSGEMTVVLRDRGGSVQAVQCALTGLGAIVFLYLYWRRGPRRAPGARDYLVFVVAFAWLVNFAFGGRDLAIPWLPIPHAAAGAATVLALSPLTLPCREMYQRAASPWPRRRSGNPSSG